MKKIHKKKITADAIAALAERGEDVTQFFAGKGKMMPGLPREDVQRVNIDFTDEVLAELDAEAKRLNISRQAAIKTMISDALDRKARARGRRKAS
ncbi:MAG: CopG family transcriptional regulator [Acidobacteria bacterium]|nr:CopG family transcriptional regulator [Acidobacteriota bacterium]MBI3657061.1 CopG family transcriptional regulator [Acidobacteriota bacterium]